MNAVGFLLAVIVFFFLAFGLPLHTFHATYGKFTLQMLSCAAALVLGGGALLVAAARPQAETAVALRRIANQMGALVRTRPAQFLIGLVALSGLSFLWSGSMAAWRWSALFLLTNAVWMILVYLWARGRRDGGDFLLSYLLVSLAVSLVGMGIYARDIWANHALWNEPTHRLMHPMGNPNFMAAFLIPPFLFALACALDEAEGSKRTWKVLLFVSAGAVLMAAFLLTGSRGGGIGLAAGFFALLLMRMGRRSRRWTMAAIAGILLIGAACALAVPQARDWLREEAFIGTNAPRSFLWMDALRMIADRPVLGWGAGGFCAFHDTIKRPLEYLYDYLRSSALSPHNEFLDYGVAYGLVGLALYVLFLVSLIVGAMRRPDFRRRPLAHKAAVAGFIGLIVHSCFDVSLRFWDVAPFFWMLAAIILTYSVPDEGEPSIPPGDRGAGAGRWLLGIGAIPILLLGLAWCTAGVVDLVGQVNLWAGRDAQKEKRYKDACAAYESALRKLQYFPDRATAQVYLSECLQQEGRVREAISVLEGLQKEAPNLRRSNLKLGLLYLQAFDQQARSEAERKTLLNSCIRSILLHLNNNHDAEGYLGLARAFCKKTPPALKEAVIALGRSLSLEPRYAAARRLLVECLRNLKDDKQARAHAEAVLRSRDAAPMDYVVLADIHRALGDKAKAQEILEFADKRFPNDPTIREAQKRLRAMSRQIENPKSKMENP